MAINNPEQIRAVVFDLGMVLLTGDYPYQTPEQARVFCDSVGAEMGTLNTGFEVHFGSYSLGQMTEDEYWNQYLDTARARNKDIEVPKRLYREFQAENEGMLSFAQQLRNRYQLGVLSTIPREWLDFKGERFGIRKPFFDPIISSGYTGLAKPNPSVYRLLLSELGMEGPQVLFIDDKETLLPPAEVLGINTILFRGQRDLEAKLQQRNLL